MMLNRTQTDNLLLAALVLFLVALVFVGGG